MKGVKSPIINEEGERIGAEANMVLVVANFGKPVKSHNF